MINSAEYIDLTPSPVDNEPGLHCWERRKSPLSLHAKTQKSKSDNKMPTSPMGCE